MVFSNHIEFNPLNHEDMSGTITHCTSKQVKEYNVKEWKRPSRVAWLVAMARALKQYIGYLAALFLWIPLRNYIENQGPAGQNNPWLRLWYSWRVFGKCCSLFNYTKVPVRERTCIYVMQNDLVYKNGLKTGIQALWHTPEGSGLLQWTAGALYLHGMPVWEN